MPGRKSTKAAKPQPNLNRKTAKGAKIRQGKLKRQTIYNFKAYLTADIQRQKRPFARTTMSGQNR
ncbi:MAG: hypothetical protein DRG59_09875, partial [Deltaproteobacteria bacterium]